MILLSANPEVAIAEREVRDWYTNQLGADDADRVVRYLWRKHRSDFVGIMQALREQTELHGPTFLRNIVAHVKRPAEHSDAEFQLAAFVAPRLADANATIVRHHYNREVVQDEERVLLAQLEERCCAMFPGKHKATMKGAIMSGLGRHEGRLTVNVGRIVDALFLADPLAATAHISRLA